VFQQKPKVKMKLFRISAIAILLAVACPCCSLHAQSDDDQLALQRTGLAIRTAFAKGDIAEAMRYHHPDVRKALSYNKVLIGRDAVAADLRDTLSKFHLEFVGNQVESLLIEKDTAVEQTLFTIKGTPIAGGEPFLFKGRTMVVYVRYKPSPTSWASIREIIQPAP
jgi:ketosteroid isomerase-like protein